MLSRKRKKRLTKAERDFYGGICAALAVVVDHDNDVIWREIVNLDDVDLLIQYATEEDILEFAGFNKYADEIEWLRKGTYSHE
jgi:hypothetical protein